MDTGTHFVMGVGLGGLAMLDSVVAQHPVMTEAVLIGTIVGSQAPDFDTVFKLKNNATYIRHHRGFSHSIPAIFIWSFLISAITMTFLPEANPLHLWLWTFLAVFIHVFVDIFNAYGTQALRPFSYRWLALGMINIFDPFIFFTHVTGILLWVLGGNAGTIFSGIYLLLILYYIWRAYAHHEVVKRIHTRIPDASYVNVSPSFHWNQWHVSVRTPTLYHVTEVNRKNIIFFNTFARDPILDDPFMNAVKKDENVEVFCSFSPIYRWETRENPDYTEVRFIDLRYRTKDGHYPFVAIAHVDRENMEVIDSFTGWVYSEEKLQKKLKPVTNS